MPSRVQNAMASDSITTAGTVSHDPLVGGFALTAVRSLIGQATTPACRCGVRSLALLTRATVKCARLQKLSPEAVKEWNLAGEPIIAKLARAPGNDTPIGRLKVVAANGWFAARRSGTEAVYKIYAESFKSEAHLEAMVSEVQAMVDKALQS